MIYAINKSMARKAYLWEETNGSVKTDLRVELEKKKDFLKVEKLNYEFFKSSMKAFRHEIWEKVKLEKLFKNFELKRISEFCLFIYFFILNFKIKIHSYLTRSSNSF